MTAKREKDYAAGAKNKTVIGEEVFCEGHHHGIINHV